MKNQRSLKAGLRRAVFCFAVMGLVTACGGPFPGYFTENTWNGNVRIPLTVLNSLSGTGTDRSLADTFPVKELIDYYEVVFTDGTGYYKGVAEKGQRYLTLTVPVGNDYKVLLLAGNSHYGTLLASAYESGVNIVPGTNTVSMTISPIIINADDIIFTINGGTTQSVQTMSSGRKYRYVALSKGDLNVVLTVNFDGQLDNLADAQGGTSFTAISHTLTISPYGVGEPFYPPYSVTSSPPNVSIAASHDYTAIPAMPSIDVTGIAQFEIKYCAFGTTASGGRTWYITNGLNSGAVDIKDEIGGGILVIVGDGGGAVTIPL
jgi:hypothetical protein